MAGFRNESNSSITTLSHRRHLRRSRVWQSWDADNHGEVSSLVMKAYAVSLLLLASVLVWTVGDAWMHFGSPSLLDSNGYSNFTVLDFA